jgi:hypothetical protein
MATPSSSNYTTETTNADGASVSISDGDTYIDDQFLVSYSASGDMSDSSYTSQLESGLRVKDLRGILGMPPQFLPTADPRIDTTDGVGNYDSFGRVYSEKIIKNIPLLLITPGVPAFMSEFSSSQKNIVAQAFLGNKTGDFDSLMESGSGKYYSLKYNYTDYFGYVNTMCRAAAYFLDIQNETVDGSKLGSKNWLYSSESGDIFGHKGLKRFLGPYAGCIAMYADCGTDTSDSFSNSTTQSSLSSSINSLSDQARELNFLVGAAGTEAGISGLDKLGMEDLESNIENMTSAIDAVGLGSGNIFNKIISQATTILAGGRLVFPEIWSDSSFGRSYSCRMKLVAVSGDKISVYLNILVPIYHLIGMVLPRQSSGQAYYSPFLVRCYYKGLFNVDMGIITDLSVTKGAEGEWTLDGIPTVAEVSFSVKDMYDGMFMSKDLGLSNAILSNVTELDYIANSCGININDQEVARTFKIYAGLTAGSIKDRVTNGIFGNVAQFFNQKMANIFGVF